VSDVSGQGLGPFHLYDAAMRIWSESNLPEFVAWLDPEVAGLPRSAFVKQATSFAVPVIHADLLCTAGPDRENSA
jgi:hypothetical protein